MKTVTVKQFWAWGPCADYTPERVEALLAGRKAFGLKFIKSLDIPNVDKLWAVLHEEFISEKNLHEFSCLCAERALTRERNAGREPDPRSWAAIQAKRDWIAGKISDDELQEARASACEAARASASASASASACASACASAREAACEAARASGWAAACEAAWASGWAAENLWQLELAYKMAEKK